MKSSPDTFDESNPLLMTVLGCSIFFTIVGPLFGSIVVYISSVVFEVEVGTRIFALIKRFIGTIIFGYLVGFIPATLTGFFCGLTYVFRKNVRAKIFIYLNVIVTTFVGVVTCLSLFNTSTPELRNQMILISGIPSIVCSLLFFNLIARREAKVNQLP